jgi:HlyD family secretion protein
MKKKKPATVLRPLILVLLIGGGAAYWLTHNRDKTNEHLSGYAEGEMVYVSSPIAGQLQDLKVQRGDQAQAGAELFGLEREEEREAMQQAEASLRESQTRLSKAKLDYDRAKSLRDKRVIASEDYDTAEQGYLAAQHNVNAYERGLAQANWRFSQKVQPAPAGGLVYDTYYRPGEWVAAGSPVASILPPEYMKVRFFLPESRLGEFPIGAPVEIRMDGLAAPLEGKVSFVSPSAEYTLPIIYSRENRNKLVFLAEARLAPDQAKQLHPGAPVEVVRKQP